MTGGFGPRPVRDDVALVLLLIADHPAGQASLIRLRPGAAQGPIGLAHLPVAEHRRQALQGLGRLGEENDAADGPVQAVWDAKEDPAGFAVALRDEGLVGLGQAFVSGLVALDDVADGLVDDQDVVVFVEDTLLPVGEFGGGEASVFHGCACQ